MMRATYCLILAEIAAFSFFFFYPYVAFSNLGFSTSGFLLHGQFWTPVTSMFVHVDLFHLAINMFFLYIFGIALEDKIGPKKTLAIFFIAGVLSLLLGTPFYSPDTHIVGASIAVSALVGAVVVIAPNRRSPLLLFAPLGLVAMIYLIFNAFMLLFDQTGGVAYQSHLIGFFMGVFFGLAWRKGETQSVRTLKGLNPRILIPDSAPKIASSPFRCNPYRLPFFGLPISWLSPAYRQSEKW
jgi:membrane associated rhomboid family serine protease